MPAMTAEQTTGYITHHLKLAGRSDPLFSDDAITLDPRRRPRPAPRRQQPRHPGARRRHGRTQEHRRRAKRPRRRHRDHDRLTTTAPARTPRPRQHPAGGAFQLPAHRHRAMTRYIVILSDREHFPAAGRRPVLRPGERPRSARTCCAARSPAGAYRRFSMRITGRRSRTRGWRGRARCWASGWSTVSRTRRKGGGSRKELNRYIREAFLAEAIHHGHRVAGPAQRLVRRVGRAGRQPAGARRDRAGPHRPVLAPAGRTGRPDPALIRRGVPLVGDPAGDPDRDRPAGRQLLRRRSRADRPAGRAAVRPGGPVPDRGVPGRQARPGPRCRS